MRDEAVWWLATARGDLEGARVLHKAGQFNLCAFHAQQAAEKALKARLGGDPTRYYDVGIAEEALRHAETLLGFAEQTLESRT